VEAALRKRPERNCHTGFNGDRLTALCRRKETAETQSLPSDLCTPPNRRPRRNENITLLIQTNGVMTMSQNASSPPKNTMANANAQLTELYVRQMANELSRLARSAGCRRLSALLTFASSAAETSLPAGRSLPNPIAAIHHSRHSDSRS
jgi:hypothetical protein